MTHLNSTAIAALTIMRDALRQDPMQRENPLRMPLRHRPASNLHARLLRASALTYGTLRATYR